MRMPYMYLHYAKHMVINYFVHPPIYSSYKTHHAYVVVNDDYYHIYQMKTACQQYVY